MPKLPQIPWLLRLAVLRLAAQWRGMVIVIIGTLLAAMVAAAMPLYTAAVTQIGMVQRLDNQPPQEVNILVRTSQPAATAGEGYAPLDAVVRGTLPDSFGAYGGWQNAVVAFSETSDIFMLVDGVEFEGFKAKLASYNGIDAGVTWEGRAPEYTDEGAVEVAISDYVAAQLGVTVGDEITLDQRGWETSIPFTARIVGIIQPVEEAGWLPLPSLRAEPDATLFTAPGTVQRAAADFIPDTRVTSGWWVMFDHPALSYTDLPDATLAAAGYEETVRGALTAQLGAESTGIVVQTELPAALGRAVTDISALGAPFVLLLLQLSALVFYFLLVMGALVRRSERRELSVLQTRGAYRRQIMAVRGLEALLICAASVIAAPTLARLFLTVFIPLVIGIERLPLDLTPETYLFAAGAGVVAFGVLMLTLWPPLNLPLIAAGGNAERSGAAAFFQRYYLDVLLLIIGFVALGQLSQREGQTIETDPLLLLVPTLLLFAMSSLSLRLFPPLMNALARVVSQSRALTGALAGWQVSREPLHYARITLMLALAVSIGWFAVSYQRTVERNRLDQASYAAGADVRLLYDVRRGGALPPTDLLTAQPDTVRVARAARFEDISLAPADSFSLDTGTILAVEPDAFAEMLAWRDDLGPLPLPEPANLPDYGRTLPDGTARLSIEAQITRIGFREFEAVAPTEVLVNEMPISLMLVDGTGQQVAVPLVPTLDDETLALLSADVFSAEDPEARLEALNQISWVRYSADLTDLVPPLSLKAFVIQNGQNNRSYFAGSTVLGLRDLRLDDTPTGWLAEPVWTPANLISVNIWEVSDALPPPEGSEFSASFNQSGNAVTAQWAIYLEAADLLARLAEGAEADGFALPAMISPRYAAQQQLEVGQKFSLNINQANIWFIVRGIAPYFPTLIDRDEYYFVTDLGGLERWLGTRPSGADIANEVWVDVTDGTSDEAWLNALAGIPAASDYQAARTRSGVLETLQTNLLTTGMIGLLLLSFVVALVLCAVSLATYASITLQARRSEFAVLRALGWTGRQVVVSILVEQTLVILTGVLLGLGIGVFLSAQVLPTLSGSDTANVLPYSTQTDPDGLLLYSGVMALLLVVQLAIAGLMVGRQTAQMLRAGVSE